MKTLDEFDGSTGLEAQSCASRDVFRGETWVRRHLRDHGRVERHSPQEEIELVRLTRKEDRKACEQLIKRNRTFRRLLTAVASALVLGAAAAARAQLTPDFINQVNRSVSLSVAATTVLAGGSGVRGGNFSSSTSAVDADLNLAKFGGSGDLGDPKPLGLLGMKWQPRLQGDIGYLTLENHFNTGLWHGDKNEYDTFAVEFGGGARFWFNDHLSLAPTISGIYGHTKNDFTANSSFGQANYDAAVQAGLINWDVDTWTIVPGAELSYQWMWRRTTFTLSSTYTYFHTQDFHSSSPIVNINSDSQTWENKFDVDVPIGRNSVQSRTACWRVL